MKALPFLGILLLLSQAPRDRDLEREGEGDRRRDLNAMEGKAAPEIEVDRWPRGEASSLKGLKGRVVLLQFWSAACGPSRGAVRHLKELHEKYRDKDLVILAIHSAESADRAPEFIREQQIPYAVAVDRKEGTFARYRVDSTPDYYLVDRKGILRFADLANRETERAVVQLLSEK